MITHVVVFTWPAQAEHEQIERFQHAIGRLTSELALLGHFDHGSDLKLREGNGDYALVAVFADEAAWRTYQAHPSHKAFLRDFVTPLQASRVAIQF